jgi:amidase
MHMKDYRRRYQEYWTSTASKSSNGKLYDLLSSMSCQLNNTPAELTSGAPGHPVEAFIAPVSPYSAVLPGKFYHSRRYHSYYHPYVNH